MDKVWAAFLALHPGVKQNTPEVMAAFFDFLAGARWMQKEAERVVPMDIAPRIRKLIKEPNA